MAQLWEENIQENGKRVWLSQALFLSLGIERLKTKKL